jgi:hypothetical protein
MRPHAAPLGLGWKAGPFTFLIRVYPVHPWLICISLPGAWADMNPGFVAKKKKQALSSTDDESLLGQTPFVVFAPSW